MTDRPGLGRTLVRCEPFARALRGSQRGIRCELCFKTIEERFQCENCLHNDYCSAVCRAEDASVHAFECHPTVRLLAVIGELCRAPAVQEESDWSKFRENDEFVTQTLLLLRILFRLKAEPNSGRKSVRSADGSQVSYDAISAPVSQRTHKVWAEEESTETLTYGLLDDLTYNFGAWISVVRRVLEMEFLRSRFGSVAEEVFIRAVRVVVRYTLYVCDTTFLTDIGKALYVEMCFVGHSCVPNCCPLFDDDNSLQLRLLDPNVRHFSELRYDFQIEMSGYSARELKDGLSIRNVDCQCVKCHNEDLFAANPHKTLTNANLKYGNWPQLEYSQAMVAPVSDAIENFKATYGRYHPWITALLLWKFKVKTALLNAGHEEEDSSQRRELFALFEALLDALSVTHGSDHKWFRKLSQFEEQMKRFVDSKDSAMNGFESLIECVEEMIPRTIIDQKLT